MVFDYCIKTLYPRYVYLARVGDLLKIGRTNHIGMRHYNLKYMEGFSEKPVDVYHQYSSQASVLELSLHKKFKDFRFTGEWFFLENEIAIEEFKKIDKFIENSDVIKMLKFKRPDLADKIENNRRRSSKAQREDCEIAMSEIRKDYFMVDKDSWVYEAFIKEDAPVWFGVDLASKDDQHIEAEWNGFRFVERSNVPPEEVHVVSKGVVNKITGVYGGRQQGRTFQKLKQMLLDGCVKFPTTDDAIRNFSWWKDRLGIEDQGRFEPTNAELLKMIEDRLK